MEDVQMDDGSSASSRNTASRRPSRAAAKRRPSTIHIDSKYNTSSEELLSPRTPKHIGKRRPSIVAVEHIQDALPRSSSRPEYNRSTSEDFPYKLRSQSSPTQPAHSDANSLAVSPPVKHRTPSISSIASLSSRMSVTSFDVHTLYKIKTTNSTKKLNSFFGETPPMDICIKEIEREGLKAMLQSKIPLCYFLRSVLEEYSSENLFFFIEVEQYESFTYVNKMQQQATAQHIYDTYLTHNSHFEVNLEDRVRRTVTTAIQNPDGTTGCFNAAKHAVFVLIEGSFQRFRANGSWDKMVKDLGELSTHYDEATRNLAVNNLLQFIEQQHDLLYTNPHTDALIPNTSRRRNELLKSMVHEFCRTLLGVEFNYYQPTASTSTKRVPRNNQIAAGLASPMTSDGEESESKSRPVTPKLRVRSKSFVAKKNKQIDALFGKKPQKGTKA